MTPFPRGQNDQITGSWRRKLYTTWLSKGKLLCSRWFKQDQLQKYKRIRSAYVCTTSQEKKPFVKNGFALFANTGKILLLPKVPLYGLFVITLISRTNAYADCGRPILNEFIERFGLGCSVPTAKPLHLVPCQSGASSRHRLYRLCRTA